MGSGLVIASVTTALKGSLADWLAANPGDRLSRQVEVSTLPPAPDRAGRNGGRLLVHLYLCHVWLRSELRRMQDAQGTHDERMVTRSPLESIELEYLIGVAPTHELDTEIVLGAALDWIHESPVMTVKIDTPSAAGSDQSWQLQILPKQLSVEEVAAVSRAIGGGYGVQIAILARLMR